MFTLKRRSIVNFRYLRETNNQKTCSVDLSKYKMLFRMNKMPSAKLFEVIANKDQEQTDPD